MDPLEDVLTLTAATGHLSTSLAAGGRWGLRFTPLDGVKFNAVRSGEWKLKLETTLVEEEEYTKVENPQTPIPEKLFNLALDPGEQKSVLKDHPKITKRLSELADRARADLGDARTGVTGKNVRPVGEVRSPSTRAAR